jgi:hypothetical protein
MITFEHATISDKYRKKWVIHPSLDDFFYICDQHGKRISETLYRKGGVGGKFQDGYILLIKHVEAFYDDNITKIPKDKPHLESQFCILNTEGVEKVNFKQFDSPYLQGGLIYSFNHKYYNIETGECYTPDGYHSSVCKCKEYIFIQTNFRGGVLKINKFDGTTEIFE